MSVVSLGPIGADLWEVRMRLPDGRPVCVVMPARTVTVQAVSLAAAAVLVIADRMNNPRKGL